MSQAELLDQFILEARECLETIGQRLLDIERDPGNAALVNDLFRNVHTLKGNCGLFEFKPLERVVHAGEDLLDRVREGTLAYNDQIADALNMPVEEVRRRIVVSESDPYLFSGPVRGELDPSSRADDTEPWTALHTADAADAIGADLRARPLPEDGPREVRHAAAAACFGTP